VPAAALAAVGVSAVHDVGRVLGRSLWLDENWVAASTRADLRDLPLVSSSTPLGWTFLLRLVPHADPEALRLLPLAFGAAAVVAAWWLGRELDMGRWAPPLLSGSVLLAPAMLVRDDLKQYTADAFVAVLLLGLVAAADRTESTRAVVIVGAAALAASPISHAPLLLAPPAFLGLLVAAVVRRRRWLPIVIVGAATGAVLLAWFAAVAARTQNDALRLYWQPFYLPTDRGLQGLLSTVHQRIEEVVGMTGVGSSAVALALAGAGCAVLWRRGRIAAALLVPLAVAEQVVLGAASRWPFLDERTSTYLLVLVVCLFAVAAAEVVGAVAQRTTVALGTLAAVGLSLAYLVGVRGFVRGDTLPRQDVEGQLEVVDGRFHRGDVILANMLAGYGIAYYGDVGWHPVRSNVVAVGWAPRWESTSIVVAGDSQLPAIEAALAEAESRVAPDGRVWLIRSHIGALEGEAWRTALAERRVEVISGGSEPAAVILPES
jgi:hypothetical protein